MSLATAPQPHVAGAPRSSEHHFIRANGSALSWERARDVADLAKAHDNQHSKSLRAKIARRLMESLDAPTHSAALNEARAIRRKLDAIDQRRTAHTAV